MGQAGTSTRRDTATGTLPPAFSPSGRIAETQPSGITATLGGTEAPAAVLSGETLRWSRLTYDGQTFALNKELTIRVTQEEGGWSFAEDEFRLLGFGHTRDEAEQSFCVDFATQWEEIACEDDAILSRGAKKLKQRLLGLVEPQG